MPTLAWEVGNLRVASGQLQPSKWPDITELLGTLGSYEEMSYSLILATLFFAVFNSTL